MQHGADIIEGSTYALCVWWSVGPGIAPARSGQHRQGSDQGPSTARTRTSYLRRCRYPEYRAHRRSRVREAVSQPAARPIKSTGQGGGPPAQTQQAAKLTPSSSRQIDGVSHRCPGRRGRIRYYARDLTARAAWSCHRSTYGLWRSVGPGMAAAGSDGKHAYTQATNTAAVSRPPANLRNPAVELQPEGQ